MKTLPAPSLSARLNRRVRPGRWAWQAVCAVAVVILTGCRTIPLPGSGTQVYQPDNIYKNAPDLALHVRRVAVMPLAALGRSSDLADGREALEPVLLAELVKTKRFEVVPVSAQVMRARTGRDTWTAADSLPPDFLVNLRDATGCDAVLFAELTEYRAYAPMAVGWRLRLVDLRTGFAIWAGDELFDAKQKDVAAAARQFRTSTHWFSQETGQDFAVLHSPRRFAEYAAAQMFDSLPVR